MHGKRDLPFAADPKSGFDMTLLRMLSFQPKQAQATENISRSTPANANNAVTTPKIHVAPTPVSVTQAVAVEPINQVKEPVPPVVVEQEQAIEAKAGELNANNWTEMVANCKLAALSRQFADNSAFIKFEDQKVHLSIAPELAHLASAKSQERLELALGKQLNSDIKIILQQDGQQQKTSPTLATQQAEKKSIRQQQAAESIHNDPAVDAIKQAFDARIIESSIKPIDN